jgi:hypothetical protein
MLSLNPAQGVHQPDQGHGRPEKEKFGGAQNEGGQEHSGFSRHC